MRRILHSQSSEPQIVVEDNEEHASEEDEQQNQVQNYSETAEKLLESPITLNPFFLSPYSRDTRKHSLPTPQCSGITASQIRRLSDRGGGGGGGGGADDENGGNSGLPGPRQTEFLATLSQAPQVSPGGRRHSVVTISKVPINKTRRESAFAGISAPFPARILPNRRESMITSYCPPTTCEPHGSVHNLHLDIMDDIVQARKVRMKVWTTSSEKLCEVQPIIDESSSSSSSSIGQRYTRRFSDFIAGSTLPTIPSSAAAAASAKNSSIKRRASELPSASSSKQKTGIVCSNSDLVSILSSLSTSETQLQHQQTSSEMVDDYLHHQQQINQLQNKKDDFPNKIEADESSSSSSPSVIDPKLLGTAIEGFLRKSPKNNNLFPSANTDNNNDVCGESSSSSSLCESLKDLFVKGVAKSVTNLGHSLYNNN